jgi:hypothetical protein
VRISTPERQKPQTNKKEITGAKKEIKKRSAGRGLKPSEKN